jgi:hypothetical protein
MVMIWIVLSLAILTVTWIILIRTAKAEVCFQKPSHDATERRGGYKWHYRIVDGKRCWYYSNLALPRDELVWGFTEEEFNQDIDRVLERKFYKPILDEHQMLMEAD